MLCIRNRASTAAAAAAVSGCYLSGRIEKSGGGGGKAKQRV